MAHRLKWTGSTQLRLFPVCKRLRAAAIACRKQIGIQNIAAVIFIQYIKITGIQRAVAFHNILKLTLSQHSAGTWCFSLQEQQQVIKQGNALILLVFHILYPEIKIAAVKLIEQLGGEVVKAVFLIELAGLEGRGRLSGCDVGAVVTYEGK